MEHIYQQSHFGENWFNYSDLYSRIVKLFDNQSRFVEIGSWKGKSSVFMAVEIANSNKNIEFYCIDTWKGSNEHKHLDLNNLYETFLHNMKPVESYYFPLKLTSVEASKKFKDNSLDFVFIDGSHEYNDVRNDIISWLPKIKDGGILAGHDYTNHFNGVIRAVNELLPNVSIFQDCFIYYKNKLSRFPSINCISIEESVDRRKSIINKFSAYDISDINFHTFPRYKDGDYKLFGTKVDQLHFHSRGPVTSHLKSIKSWVNNTTEEYTFFCEDDISLETVQYWNFNWKEFFQNLPKDWELIQLAWIREPEHFLDFGFKMRNRCWCDWSGCAYLIKREFAKKLIDNYHPNEYFFLEYQGFDANIRDWWALIPTIETIIFSNIGKVYSFPLFMEDTINCPSTYAENGQGYLHLDSHESTKQLWKDKLQYMTIQDLIQVESSI
jgi:hypothetical protein